MTGICSHISIVIADSKGIWHAIYFWNSILHVKSKEKIFSHSLYNYLCKEFASISFFLLTIWNSIISKSIQIIFKNNFPSVKSHNMFNLMDNFFIWRGYQLLLKFILLALVVILNNNFEQELSMYFKCIRIFFMLMSSII